MRQNRDGAAGQVDKRLRFVDSQVPIDCGQQILRRVGTFGRVLGLGICRADDLAHSQSTAGDQRRVGLGPMIASNAGCISAQPRCATEFPHHDDQHALVEAAFEQILDQRGECLIEIRLLTS